MIQKTSCHDLNIVTGWVLIRGAIHFTDIQDAQLVAMKPGMQVNEVDAIAREPMISSGLKASYANISGRSLGYYQLFTSRSSDFSYVFWPTDTWTIKSGMIYHMYSVATGLAFSEIFLITNSGGKRFTQSKRSILTAPANISI